MIKKFRLGNPIDTKAVTASTEIEDVKNFPLELTQEERLVVAFSLDNDAMIFGLGESVRGINKRGWIYESWCSDETEHTEDKRSLYGAHNFIVVSSENGKFGLFVDFAGKVEWDLCYSQPNEAKITLCGSDADIYFIDGETERDIVKQFRNIIGKSYIPPFWAFGYQQSCWGYAKPSDFTTVRDNHRKNNLPLDCIYMDIDYMERFKDFTVNRELFPDFRAFVSDMKAHNIHLIPIIDAGVKKEEGYSVYDEGHEKGYFCKNADGTDFECGVWPGIVGLPDFLNKEAREWFGSQYRTLIDMGIDGFWNDMNEPALFYSKKGLETAREKLRDISRADVDIWKYFDMRNAVTSIQNSMDDYSSFYHNIDGRTVCHKDVHNIYGAFMTNAAGEYFEREYGKEKLLIFSRASYIGAHRTSGIWFGDNYSWWEHILLNLKMLPSVNMCGFLYCGADIGGFNKDVTEDLLLRWLALGVFTPLMRNHRALGTRAQEAYRFSGTEKFADVLSVRYRLIPYIYKTFRRCSDEGDMMFRPLAFDYPDDRLARETEDQLMLGGECMIAPVYQQNKSGRTVYLPEPMTFVKLSGENVSSQKLEKGLHYVEVELNEVPLFIRQNKKIPLASPALNTAELDTENLKYIG
ncbi:MAG: glycoside hydrolase family 31 protein [Ruminococcus sp.]|nr:glycoside hydrolase family 31 protein [Ruminococcus sp.]